MRYVIASAAALGLAAFVVSQSPASAQNPTRDAASAAASDAARADRMTIGAVAAKLEGQGYSVRAIEIDDGAYEVEVVDRQGARLTAHLDPTTGEPVGRWNKDD